MSENANFLIFSFGRTGSTLLTHILNSHPSIKCLNEPFNPGQEINWQKEIADLESLKTVLRNIYNLYNGIRHLSRDLAFNYNKYLLLNKHIKVIFLWRKNFLQQTMSWYISRQTNSWFVQTKHKILDHKFKPADINEIKEYLNSNKKEYSKYLSLLKTERKEFFELNYEDCFSLDISIDNKVSKVKEILTFLGYNTLLDETILKRIKHLLNPEIYKLNSERTYRLIPNVEDIERELGSSENGHLFSA